MLSIPSSANAATGPGPYYAEPAWDQKLQCDTAATCPRFIVLSNWNNEAVLDRETGLVWEQSPDGFERRWQQALDAHCVNRVVGGRKGWHLPLREQLASLVDNIGNFPALPTGHPFSNISGGHYWSATTSADEPDRAYGVFFNGGGVNTRLKTQASLAWCVRGGQSFDGNTHNTLH
jgi:hypothetical protein